jgi:hypothetical protein
MVRKLIYLATLTLFVVSLIFGWNYISVYKPASEAISSDSRNKGIEIVVHYKSYINPSVLIYDLRGVTSENSPSDVTRTLFQVAKSLKDKKFDHVILCYKGREKFMLKGEYFYTLGVEYGSQNPIYTLRTLPENTYNLDGKKAFESWTGGWLGVLGKQMDDLNEFNRSWFLSDAIRED